VTENIAEAVRMRRALYRCVGFDGKEAEARPASKILAPYQLNAAF